MFECYNTASDDRISGLCIYSEYGSVIHNQYPAFAIYSARTIFIFVHLIKKIYLNKSVY